MSWAPRVRTWKLLGQSQPGLPIPLSPIGAPAECHPRLAGPYQDRPVVGPRGLLPSGYEDMEPPPGADPGHPPYEGGAAAVRGGEATGAGIEPTWPTAWLVTLASNQETPGSEPGGSADSPSDHR